VVKNAERSAKQAVKKAERSAKKIVKEAKKAYKPTMAETKKKVKKAKRSAKKAVKEVKTVAQKEVVPALKGIGERAGLAVQHAMHDAAEAIHSMTEKLGQTFKEPAKGRKKKSR
jgi:vacuolar-type H+-ATPase subunit H